ncbi:hypothetical protein PG985_012759 [Apiospora marii]|uniref:uncharacterized protein n=1 Tax=Apiospora marii TaxID=335849 RepID=UPI00312EE8A5
MADDNNKNDKPSKGDEGDEKPIIMNHIKKLHIEEIRFHHPDGPNAEQWATIARNRGMSVSDAKQRWAELEAKFVEVTKDEVRTEAIPKRRKRTPKKVAPVLDDEDEEIDDEAPSLTLPRPSQRRPGTQNRLERVSRRPRGTRASTGMNTFEQAPPPGPDTAATRSAPKRKAAEETPTASKRRATAEEADDETGPASPSRRSPSPAESESFLALSPEEVDEMRERLARAAPMSAVYSEWWLMEARRKWYLEHPGQYLPGEEPEQEG